MTGRADIQVLRKSLNFHRDLEGLAALSALGGWAYHNGGFVLDALEAAYAENDKMQERLRETNEALSAANKQLENLCIGKNNEQ